MAEPFVFHFKPGPEGHPEALYMLDLDCTCGLCGHDQFQRFYHSTPFHELTVKVLRRLLDEGPAKAGYDCENCGEEVQEEQVQRACLTYGFADDAGLIQLFDDLTGEERKRTYQLTESRRLDPQAIPRWEPDSEPSEERHIVEKLNEDIIEDHLGRPINLKLAWRDLLEDWFDDPEGGAFSRLADDIWAVIDADEASAGELAQEIDDEDFWEDYDDGNLAVISLHDSVPVGLATHAHPDKISGRWMTWLSDDLSNSLIQGEVWADAYLLSTSAIDIISRAFDVARLTYRRQDTDADIFFTDITTPTGAIYGPGLSISSVLRRAVFTGLTPGDAARLTAEEIIGVLLQVWK